MNLIATDNLCGGCTSCCYLFKVQDLEKQERQDCIHCTNQCEIYDTRPGGCIGFDCSWLQIPGAPIELRPDHCGIVFEKINNNLFHGCVDERMEISDFGKQQVAAFVRQGFSVILRYEFNRHEVFLAEGHNKDEMVEELQTYSGLKYGSTDV